MSDTQLSPDDAATKARQLIEADVAVRVNAVRDLASAANDADAAERQARDAATAHESAWATALKAGWSEKDLRATGVRSPGPKPRRGRPRSTATTALEG